jgi:tetratricopeptide (TPR) repeat protein
MKFKMFLSGLLVVAFNYFALQGQTLVLQKSAGVKAFVNVSVVPMDKEGILNGQTVVVRDGQIVEIGSSKKVKVPKGAEIIHGRGKYLMPGLLDMHAHLNSPHELPVFLANGVTTVYNLNGRPAHLLWRDKIVKGEMPGPTIYTCGPTIRTAGTAEQAKQIIEEQSRAGYDSIKIYNAVSKEAYPVLIDEAKRRKMLIVGHIPREPKFEDVIKSGMAIAHAEEFVYTFFNNNPDDYSRIPEIAAMTRENNVPVILTLVAFDHIIRQAEDLPALLALPEFKYLAPWVRATWQPGKNLYQKRFANDEGRTYLKKSLAFQKKFVQAFRQAGVKIMVGTDAMNMGVVPGFSVHEELRNLVEIGFSPFEALQAATRTPAEFLRANEFGTVSVGKRADLILVDGNPLEDVSRVSKPAGVMVRGRWLLASELRRMLDEVPITFTKEEQYVRANLSSNSEKIVLYLNENDPLGNLLNASVETVAEAINKAGAEWFVKTYDEARKNRFSPFGQGTFVYQVGQQLLKNNKTKDAIEVLKLNVRDLPRLADVHYELAEAYLADGQKELAKKYCKMALEINPNHSRSIEMLKKIE